jgi:hypothetical protein
MSIIELIDPRFCPITAILSRPKRFKKDLRLKSKPSYQSGLIIYSPKNAGFYTWAKLGKQPF